MNNNGSDTKQKQIIAAVIILIILLLGWYSGRKISESLLAGSNNPQLSRIAEIIRMPFFYVVEYPKIILELSSGKFPYYAPPKPKPQKQFIKFPGY